MTARELTRRENRLFHALEDDPTDRTFADGLCRDGVPSPGVYLRQRVRVLFVFREPNLNGAATRLDLRDEIRDAFFRPLQDGERQERRPSCWWNAKAGMFAHAVAAAIDRKPWSKSFREFRSVVDGGRWNHDVVNRFAYIQIKKVGGRGTIDADEVCRFAARYRTVLKAQIELYKPHLIIGGGVPPASPAQLLSSYVLNGGSEAKLSSTRATWWRFGRRSRPVAMLQHWHPARRGSQSELYRDLWTSVSEILRTTRLPD
jgi:hypothetical protein